MRIAILKSKTALCISYSQRLALEFILFLNLFLVILKLRVVYLAFAFLATILRPYVVV